MAMSGQRRFLVLAGIAAFLVVVAYLVLDNTVAGQAWSDQAYLGRVLQPIAARRFDNQALHWITPVSTGAMCVLLLVIGLARREWVVGLAAALGLGIATVIAEVLRIVLPHPDLASGFEALMGGKTFQTFPSGHATIATATVLSLLLVCSQCWRIPIAVVGTLGTTLVAAGTVAAGWHRPGDALGGIAIASAVLALVAWGLTRRWGQATPASIRQSLLVTGCCVAAAIGVLLYLSDIEAVLTGQLPPGVHAWAFPSAIVVIGAAAATAICAYAWVLQGVRLTVPNRRDEK